MKVVITHYPQFIQFLSFYKKPLEALHYEIHEMLLISVFVQGNTSTVSEVVGE